MTIDINQPRKTKIVATIGPASDSVDTLKQMILAGMNVARINLSFGVSPAQVERVRKVRLAAKEVGAHVAIMADTKGPEIRSGKLEDGELEVLPGRPFCLFNDGRKGNSAGVSISYDKLYQQVEPGTPILLDDGAIELEVERVEGETICCRVLRGGLLRENKGVNLPKTRLALGAVGPENLAIVEQEMRFAVENDIEYIASSFIQSGEDIRRLREVLREMGANIPIIAKIENRAGVDNLEEIIEASDGVMVARGDMGVELPLADVPGVQKRIIRLTVTAGKPVITATQMLATMEYSLRPSRAEASDVANAILDGTSAVMLSGETAAGKYPVESVKMMHDLASRAESFLEEYGYLQQIRGGQSNKVTEAVSQAALSMSADLKAAAIVCLTETGFTSRQISKRRPMSPILAITGSEMVARRTALNWGVLPLLYQGSRDDDAKIQFAVTRGKEMGYIRTGDVVVITAGQQQSAGGTDMIRVVTIQ